MRTKTETALSVMWGLFVRIAVVVLLVYVVYHVRSIIVCVMVAVMLAYVMLPGVEFLCSRRFGSLSYKSQRLLASIVVFIVLLGLAIVLMSYVVAPFKTQVNSFKGNVDTYIAGLEKLSKRAGDLYAKLPDDVKDLFGDKDKSRAKETLYRWVNAMWRSTAGLASHIVDIILIPVLAFYFVLDYRTLRREFVGALPKSRRREALKLLRSTGGILQNYAVGQLILCIIAGVLTALALWVFHIDYLLALAVLAGVTRAIPIVGPIIAGAVITLIGLLKSPIVGINLLAFFSLMHLVESKFILPKLIGDRMRLHPAVIIIVLLIGAEFFGIFGMFLAAPVAAAIRELVRFYIIEPSSRREERGEEEEERGAVSSAHTHEDTVLEQGGLSP